MAGQKSQACRDTRAGPPWRRAPRIYLGVRPDRYVGGPVVKQGAQARASLWGRVAVNFQCFKILAKRQSACGRGALNRASWYSDRAAGMARSLARTKNLDKSSYNLSSGASPGQWTEGTKHGRLRTKKATRGGEVSYEPTEGADDYNWVRAECKAARLGHGTHMNGNRSCNLSRAGCQKAHPKNQEWGHVALSFGDELLKVLRKSTSSN